MVHGSGWAFGIGGNRAFWVRIGIKGLGVRVWGWVWGCGWRFWDYIETLQGEGLRILVMGLGFGVSGSRV